METTVPLYYVTVAREGDPVGKATPIPEKRLTRLACDVYAAGSSTHATAAAMEARHAMGRGTWAWHNPHTGSHLAIALHPGA